MQECIYNEDHSVVIFGGANHGMNDNFYLRQLYRTAKWWRSLMRTGVVYSMSACRRGVRVGLGGFGHLFPPTVLTGKRRAASIVSLSA